MSSDAPVTFLTQDAYDRLVAELDPALAPAMDND